jgi:hypothetical protein
MTISAYKNRKLPRDRQLCLVCQLKTRLPVVEVHLDYDVSVHLCTVHASRAFQSMRRGRDFVVTIERAWQAANCLTPDRRRALAAHRDRFRRRRRGAPRPPERSKPGSYAWKFLRDQLERRAAAGEAAMSIIRDLRERHRHDVADMPSISTMRRWYRQARWKQGIRTALRPGFERRDVAHASRAQRVDADQFPRRGAYERGDTGGRAGAASRTPAGGRRE